MKSSGLVEDFALVDPQSHMNFVNLRYQLVDTVNRPEYWLRSSRPFSSTRALPQRDRQGALELSEGCISQILRHALTELREHLEGSLFEHEGLGGWGTF